MAATALTLVPEPDAPHECLPHVSVEVDGVVVDAILDSGAGRTQITWRPGLDLRAAPENGGTGATGAPLPSLGRCVVSLRIAGIEVGPLEVDVVPPGGTRRTDLVGQDVLSRFRCLYELVGARLTLDADPPETTAAVWVGQHGHVLVETSWPGHDVSALALLDTGASSTVVDTRFAERHPELVQLDGVVTGQDASGATFEARTGTVRGPVVLGAQLDRAAVAAMDLGAIDLGADRAVELVLGWSTLRQADWYVDHSGRRAACLPLSTFNRSGQEHAADV